MYPTTSTTNATLRDIFVRAMNTPTMRRELKESWDAVMERTEIAFGHIDDDGVCRAWWIAQAQNLARDIADAKRRAAKTGAPVQMPQSKPMRMESYHRNRITISTLLRDDAQVLAVALHEIAHLVPIESKSARAAHHPPRFYRILASLMDDLLPGMMAQTLLRAQAWKVYEFDAACTSRIRMLGLV